jgi:hypothetical protein
VVTSLINYPFILQRYNLRIISCNLSRQVLLEFAGVQVLSFNPHRIEDRSIRSGNE